jgi:hypothetical protein
VQSTHSFNNYVVAFSALAPIGVNSTLHLLDRIPKHLGIYIKIGTDFCMKDFAKIKHGNVGSSWLSSAWQSVGRNNSGKDGKQVVLPKL